MSRKPSLLRSLIGVFLALVFVVAAQPGTMAMPASGPAAMANASMPGCDHMQPLKEKEPSHKNTAFCPGMLVCYGMAAVAVEYAAPMQFAVFSPAPQFERAAPGLAHPPENPPPIA
jgi:hypothetical protein